MGLSSSKWHKCVLCEEDIFATPSHLKAKHDMEMDEYHTLANQMIEDGEVDEEELKAHSKKNKKKDDGGSDVSYGGGSGSPAEQTVSRIAEKSFIKTMQDMDERKEELKQREQQAEQRQKEIERRLLDMTTRRNENSHRRTDPSDDFLRTIAEQYFHDLREEKNKTLVGGLENVKQHIDDIVREEVHKSIKESMKESEEYGKKIEITDESIKAVSHLGEQLVGYLRQNQLLKYAQLKSGGDIDPKLESMILQDLNAFNKDMTGQGLENMVSPELNSGNPSPTKKKKKTLEELLAEEE